MKIRNDRGMSLIEVLVSGIVIAIVATAGWFGAGVALRSGQMSTNQMKANHLMQKSYEEVLNAAYSWSFNNLNLCDFPPAATTCRLSALGPEYAGFTRRLNVVNQDGAELKRVTVTLSWMEMGIYPRNMTSVFLIARPPDPLPGNVLGRVTDQFSGNPVDGVKIMLEKIDDQGNLTGLKMTTLSDENGDYDFSGGANAVEAGLWQLTATKKDYDPYTHPVSVQVVPGDATVVNFVMIPTKAEIIIHLVDEGGNPIAPRYQTNANCLGPDPMVEIWYTNNTTGQRSILVDKDGQECKWTYASSNSPQPSSFSCVIDYGTLTPQGIDITVLTENMFRGNLVGTAGRCDRPAGNQDTKTLDGDWVPANTDNTEEFCYRGWSSAVFGNTQTGCTWKGSPGGCDRIHVDPGARVSVDIPLRSIPMVNMTATVSDANDASISDARVYVRYSSTVGHSCFIDCVSTDVSGVCTSWTGYALNERTDAAGALSAQVPAAWQFFSGNDGRLSLLAGATVSTINIPQCDLQQTMDAYRYNECCSADTSNPGCAKYHATYCPRVQEDQCFLPVDICNSQWKQIYAANNAFNVNFTISGYAGGSWGNLQGSVIDGYTMSAVGDADVNIHRTNNTYNYNTSTNGSGSYSFDCGEGTVCNDEPDVSLCSVLATTYVVNAQKTGHYPFSSEGNIWYTSQGNIAVPKNTTVTYPQIKLWPRLTDRAIKIYGLLTDSVSKEKLTGRNFRIWLRIFFDTSAAQVFSATASPFTLYQTVEVVAPDGSLQNWEIMSPETWPPAALTGCPGGTETYYNCDPFAHEIYIYDPTGEYFPKTVAVNDLKADRRLDIELDPVEGPGGM